MELTGYKLQFVKCWLRVLLILFFFLISQSLNLSISNFGIWNLQFALSQNETEEAKNIFKKAVQRVKTIECVAFSTTYHYEKEIGKKKIKIYAKEPDKLRIEYLEPKEWEGSYVIFDGKTIYHYTKKIGKAIKFDLTKIKTDEKREQVTSSKNLDMQLSSITNLVAKDIKTFFEKNEFVVLGKEKLKDKETYKIQIIPKAKSKYKVQQIIWIDTKEGLTWKIDFLLEMLNRQEIIEMEEIKTNVNIPDEKFIYTGETL